MKLKAIFSSILFCALFVAILLLTFKLSITLPHKFERLITGLSGTVVALSLSWIFVRFQKKTLKDIGLYWQSKTLKRFLIGCLLGFLIAISMIGILIIMTDLEIHVEENYNIISFIFWTLALIPLAFMEEVIFRGLPLIRLNKAIGIRLSILIMAILFALYHFDSASILTMLIGPGVWGVIYGISAIWSDGISLPTGIHYAANVTLAAIGMKKEYEGLFEIGYNQEVNPEILNHTETVGIIVQIILLILGLFVVEWYLKNKKYSDNKVYHI
ncbi:type II CAAX endopeptidase family protein [Spongiivirga sp. MCCC 1A20706]|uniref:CPBP family intramembrane glutamic endopeptidase n=1 Tax=Spongiivirga sp. MCCC 1A20706 TaxID=3160963 RepID=UPI0039773E6D